LKESWEEKRLQKRAKKYDENKIGLSDTLNLGKREQRVTPALIGGIGGNPEGGQRPDWVHVGGEGGLVCV